jgi:hypothetical protein
MEINFWVIVILIILSVPTIVTAIIIIVIYVFKIGDPKAPFNHNLIPKRQKYFEENWNT